jgi:transcription elongation GreA/GreB family factor
MKLPDKEKILAACKELLMQRIATAEQAMKAAQEASNSEDKSSAGDKYETARAMGQLDRDMNARQLAQAQKELAELVKISLLPFTTVKTGALVHCDTATYFIATGLGPVTIEGQQVVVLSPLSPLARLMAGKSAGDSFLFNQKLTTIRNVA